MSGEPSPPRIVTPRRVKETPHLGIVAVSLKDREVYVERQDLAFTLDALPLLIQGEPPSLIVCDGADRMLKFVDRELGDNPHWQYKIGPNRLGQTDFRTGVVHDIVRGTIVYWCGFRASRPNGKTANRPGTYHVGFDSDVFTNRGGMGALSDAPIRHVLQLANWGDDVRSWIEAQKLRWTPTQGGLGAQLLKDPRWFPDARRKVPRATNARIRPTLPGNHYDLRCKENEIYNAYYLDMKASHHTIATALDFPHPEDFFARGRFNVTDDTDVTVSEGEAWTTIGKPAYRRIMSQAKGLLLVELSVPPIPPERFPLPCLRKPGRKVAYVYTNELATIQELGGVIDAVRAGWFSYTRCWGLNRYARWALAQIDAASEERKLWLKPALLSAYGVLAARPRTLEFGFKQAKSGVPREYPAGSGMLACIAHIGDRAFETPIANVVYRGMIEAEQRIRALHLARYLASMGSEVLSVYADSVFVESSSPLPFLPDGWEVRDQLTRIQWYSPTAFQSVELSKFPGIPRDAIDRAGRMQRIRALNAPNAA